MVTSCTTCIRCLQILSSISTIILVLVCLYVCFHRCFVVLIFFDFVLPILEGSRSFGKPYVIMKLQIYTTRNVGTYGSFEFMKSHSLVRNNIWQSACREILWNGIKVTQIKVRSMNNVDLVSISENLKANCITSP